MALEDAVSSSSEAVEGLGNLEAEECISELDCCSLELSRAG